MHTLLMSAHRCTVDPSIQQDVTICKRPGRDAAVSCAGKQHI